MWYCVLNIADYSLVYLGQDEVAARLANGRGTYMVTRETELDAYRVAARNLRYLQRGRPVPADYDNPALIGFSCDLTRFERKTTVEPC